MTEVLLTYSCSYDGRDDLVINGKILTTEAQRTQRKLNLINLCAFCDSVVKKKLSMASFVYTPYADWAFDDIQIVSDYLSDTTTTYAYNGDNEMTSMTACNETTNFTYDNWGRMDSKYTDDYNAAYTWRYNSKLYSVTSTFPDEGNVTYNYGGDGKRRSRNATGGDYTWFNYDAGWGLINEETGTATGTGSLTKTHIGRLAEVAGTSPSTGSYKYYVRDNLGSVRAQYDQSKSILGNYEYTPYGSPFAYAGPAIADLQEGFTGHKWEQQAGMYYAPYRYYNPGMARWAKRDPLGMVDGPNLYGYTNARPISFNDPMGGSIVAVAGLALIGLIALSCGEEANIRAKRGPQGASTQHCVFGCEFAKCAGKILGSSQVAYAINWYNENRERHRDPSDSYNDDEAAHWGAEEASKDCADCADTCGEKYPFDYIPRQPPRRPIPPLNLPPYRHY